MMYSKISLIGTPPSLLYRGVHVIGVGTVGNLVSLEPREPSVIDRCPYYRDDRQ